MKKTLIKIVVFILVFVVTVLVASGLMNKGHDNMTMEIAPATLPIITFAKDDMEYNEMHGYVQPMDTAFQREMITVLGESRDVAFVIDTYGRQVAGIVMQVRSIDGSRLIEDTMITDYYQRDKEIRGEIALKDLIEPDTQYSLAIILELEDAQKVYYYTRVVWGDNLYDLEKLAFVKDFHEKTFDKTAAKEITKYLETNSNLEDNSSFNKVNIHSSFQQITWGNLAITETTEPVLQLTEVAEQTASILLRSSVATAKNSDVTHYWVEEYYRVRYTTDRIYLLDFERTMTQIPDVDSMYANDKILLGIVDKNVSMMESADGNIVVFEVANRLFSYNVTTNKLAVIFSFYDQENGDARTIYNQHAIKILDVDEGGNVQFAVYGYMNRGRHEGEVGVQVRVYDNALNTIEEEIYIPYSKSYTVLKAEMDELLYLNREQKLYLTLENRVYGIDLVDKSCEVLVNITQEDSMHVSENHRIMVWQKGEDIYNCEQLSVRNLNVDVENVITVKNDEAICPLGFMGEDVIYGVAKKADIIRENTGRIFFPMYKVCICDSEGKLLKEYQQSNVYITDCTIVGNQITLERYSRDEEGNFDATEADHIMNNIEEEVGKNVIVAADIDTYERYVQIQTRVTIDSKTIKILTPKEVVFEGGRELGLTVESDIPRYYVYGGYGVEDICTTPGSAVNLAYEKSGVVVNDRGECIWLKGNRVAKNQIMAIKENEITEEKGSMAVCIDTILAFEGIICDSQALLNQGNTVMEILEDNLPDGRVLDLTGCTLDAVLYYVNQDIPVLAMLENGEAVLVTGFNEFNVVIMNPMAGTLKKEGMNDSTAWFLENGNRFVTYARVGE